jgi:hypothetical protein
MFPQEWFGRVDLIVAGVIALVLLVGLIVEIPDIVRYTRIKSM